MAPVTVAGMALAAVFLAAPTARAADRPNLLFIMADDLGKEWLSCYGSEGHKTPQIDRLAEGGMRFENVWATPLCTPTRNVLLTGRYPLRTGWTVHHDTPRWGGQYFDWNREITIARVLKSAGYATAIAGKWQINDLRTQPDALQRHGFDEHCLWPGWETGNPASESRHFDPFMQINGKRGVLKGKFSEDVTCEFLIDFMRRHRDGPFFAYYPMILPHTPMTRTPANLDTKATGVDLHPGMVDYIDGIVGRLVATLDELGIRDNTLVIFTADNGSPGLRMRMNGLEVVGGKSRLTESGICMSFIANWPGHVPRYTISEALVDFSDVFPTLAELAGAKLPEGVVIDGRSFVPELLGRADPGGGRQWTFSQLGKRRVVRDRRYKLFSTGELYDLQADPLEKHDLSSDAAPAVVAAKAKLQAVLEALPADAKLPFPPHAASKPDE